MACMSSIAVFCGSSAGRHTACAAAAEAFGRRAAEQGIRIVFGGGAVGLMGILGQAALGRGAMSWASFRISCWARKRRGAI